MKIAIAFALITACIAATYRAPITHAPDYTAVGLKVNDVLEAIIIGFNQIKIIANNDNPAVGYIISRKLDVANVQAVEVYERARAAIAAQSLTVAQAKGLISELTDIVFGVLNDTQDERLQLSTTASNQITDHFFGTYAAVPRLGHEIYALLAQ
ncbi:unnamed protein product [Orchesella dallaii]|uniref:Uncharacterized protein n=1 Tax=Orchesella dallaii TaxID=48710 RepID=A0ABP1PS83_9HEXA